MPHVYFTSHFMKGEDKGLFISASKIKDGASPC